MPYLLRRAHLAPLFLLALAFALFAMLAHALGADAATAAATAPTVVTPSGGILNVGAAFGWLGPYIDSFVNALLSVALGWIFWLLKTKLNVSIDADHRATLTLWAQRQASAIVGSGEAKLSGLTVNVGTSTLSRLAVSAEQRIPDALKYLGVTPDQAAKRVVDWVPHVPLAAVAAAVPKPVPPMAPARA